MDAIREELKPIKKDINRLDTRVEQNTTRLDTMEQDINRLKVLMENDIPKQFNLLAEGQRLLLERMQRPDKVDNLESRVDTLETVVKSHSADIAELKKAL